MTTPHLRPVIACSLLLASSTLPGAEDGNLSRFFRYEQPTEPRLNRVSVGYRVGFNISAQFKNLGQFTRSNPGSDPAMFPPPPSVDRTYDDGFVRVDSLNNAGGVTTFFGYDSSSQLNGPNATATELALHSATLSPPNQSSEANDSPHHGLEVIYNRELGRGDRFRWGLEGGFGYSPVCIQDNSKIRGTLTIITDTYDISGLVPRGGIPPAPYSGPYSGVGGVDPEIPETPTRTIDVSPPGTIIPGRRKVDANFYNLRVGPYLEYPTQGRWSFLLSGGLALAYVDSRFTWSETGTIGAVSTTAHGSERDSDILVGGYVSGTALYALNNRWNLFGSVQYQGLTDFTQKASSKEVTLSLDSSVFLVFGLGYSF